MRLPALFRTNVFQLTLMYVGLFSLSVGALFAFLYWSTIGYVERQTNAIIEAEIDGLAEQAARQGLRGLADVINERVQRDREQRFVYVLADAIGRVHAGNVNWPRELDDAEGRVDVVLVGENGVQTPARAYVMRVGPGLRLLVGRDVRELREITTTFRRAAVYGLSLVIGLGLVGGLAMALSAQRRIAQLNRTTREIIAGDLSRRAPVSGTGDEHDELAANVNAMLDQIESLMEGMRHVGDSVAHDLRGPLTRLRNRLETLAAAEQPSREDLLGCVEQAERLLDTFNALLRIARVESGAYRSAFAPLDLVPIVRDVCELYQAAADERRIGLHCRIPNAAEVFGDRELLAQALTNLLDNAVKYTPAGGSIVVALRDADDRIFLSVADSGPGIPPAERERVLERFARLDQARSQPGNGLGLALVKAVAAQHNGRIVLDDNSPGLRVTLELPAHRRGPARPPAAPERPSTALAAAAR
ncbi:MAG TPA: HAMP domain-containing sensor histidine kinase [Gammaproteobacteria bacterium]